MTRAGPLRPFAGRPVTLVWICPIAAGCLITAGDVSEALDPDGDGVLWPEDCANSDLHTFPGAPEICGDHVVNDCNGTQRKAWQECFGALRSLPGAATLRFLHDADEGHSLAATSTEDRDDDGVRELVFGAYVGTSSEWLDDYETRTAAYVLRSPFIDGANAEISLEYTLGRLLGVMSVDSAGDLNGDGHEDLLLGSHYLDDKIGGRIRVVRGPTEASGHLDDALVRFGRDTKRGRNGWTVAGLGDVNGDGFDDIASGAVRASFDLGLEGAAYLHFDSPSDESDEVGVQRSADLTICVEFESSLAGLGDVTGDGHDDVVVGDEGGEGHASQARLLTGSAHPSLSDTLHVTADTEAPEDINGGLRAVSAVVLCASCLAPITPEGVRNDPPLLARAAQLDGLLGHRWTA